MKAVKDESGEKQYLLKDELEKTQMMHTEFNKLKSHLAEVSLQKHGILKQIDLLRGEFARHENELMEKYGVDAVINIQTGEVTKKEQ